MPVLTTDKVLADETIKGVVISVPAEYHKEIAIKAITRGKHVFIEKPVALSVADAELICNAAKVAGVVVMAGHLLQYHPAFVKLKDMVHSGALGKLHYAYSSRLSMGKTRAQEDVKWSLAPHDISMLLALFNEMPSGVESKSTKIITPNIADESRINLFFSSGAHAHIFVSWLHPFKEQRLVVVGDNGMAVFEDTHPDWHKKLFICHYSIDRSRPLAAIISRQREYIPVNIEEPLKIQCQHFLDCIIKGIKPLTGPEEMLRVLQVLEGT